MGYTIFGRGGGAGSALRPGLSRCTLFPLTKAVLKLSTYCPSDKLIIDESNTKLSWKSVIYS